MIPHEIPGKPLEAKGFYMLILNKYILLCCTVPQQIPCNQAGRGTVIRRTHKTIFAKHRLPSKVSSVVRTNFVLEKSEELIAGS